MVEGELTSLIAEARRAHEEWWNSDEDDEDLTALAALHDLSKVTKASPTVDHASADAVVEEGIKMLRSTNPVERIFGIRLIREMHREDEVSRELLRSLRRETDDEVISWCIGGLYFRGCEEAIPDLVEYVDHPDPDVRYRVAGAISTCVVTAMTEQALRALLTLVEDEVDDVRFSAMYEVSSWWQAKDLRDFRVEAALKAGASDRDEGVRNTCNEALAST